MNQRFELENKQFEGFVIPIGPVNLVFATGWRGLVGCGAIDAVALEKFSYPAAKVKPPAGLNSVSTIDDLLKGEIVVVNAFAAEHGVKTGMSGREALALLS